LHPALLILDLQNDYFPGGNHPLAGSLAAGKQATRLLEYFRATDLPVIFIQHISTRPGATFFLPDTHGVEIHPSVKPAPDETIITKHFPNCFRQTTLLEHLNKLQVRQLVVSGMMTHMCLDAGVRAAVDLGFECTVAADACATCDLVFAGQTIPASQVQAGFLAALASAYAKVLNTDDILASLNYGEQVGAN
jgi:nicotinamidase-related amidase